MVGFAKITAKLCHLLQCIINIVIIRVVLRDVTLYANTNWK